VFLPARGFDSFAACWRLSEPRPANASAKRRGLPVAELPWRDDRTRQQAEGKMADMVLCRQI
jgi:hypothetical protein